MRVRTHLGSLIDDFEEHGNQIAFVTRRGLRWKRTTYRELALLARRFAAELETRGIEKGDRVIIWGENGPEWAAAFFGCILRGVLPVALDLVSTSDFARRVEVEVSPKLAVTDSDKVPQLASTTPALELESLEQTITDEKSGGRDDLQEADPLQIVFTSGTTGEPKGVVHTHGNVLASLRPIEAEVQKYLKYERPFHPVRILHTLPLSHVFGQFMGLWIPPLFAAEVHFESRLVPGEIIERIRRERISVAAVVPRVLELTQRHLTGRIPDLAERIRRSGGLPVWRKWWRFRDVHRLFGWKFWAFVCGGASLPAEAEHFWERVGLLVIQGYGMTETTALITLNHPFRAASGTVGQVLPGREVRLTEEGEVLVRGATISNVIWQGGRPESRTDDWLRTGDLAEFDASGNLLYRGRKKDVIVTSGGLNIYPEDLERALKLQPGVRDAAVIEVPSEQGPQPLSALILEPGASAATALDAANQSLAGYQQIRRWIIWPEPDFPRTSTGKVLHREIARRLESGELEGRIEQTAHELNLDSLGRVQLQAEVEERYGVALPDDALQRVNTQEEMETLIRDASQPGQGAIGGSDRHYYPKWVWRAPVQALRSAFLQLIAMPLTRFLAKPRVVRTGPMARGPMLIVANHITSYDAAFVLYGLNGHLRRHVAIGMAGEMLLDFRRGRNQGSPILNALSPAAYFLITVLFNVFPLPQYSGFRRSFAHAGEAADRGYSVLVFPEGRRSDDGRPQPFKAGAGLLWKELGVPALPVYIEGLGEIKAQGARWFRTGRITVRVRELLELDPHVPPEELTEQLRRGVFGQLS